MSELRPIHDDFHFLLSFKEQGLVDLFCDLRAFILDIYPDSNEMLYQTYALTTAFSISERLGDTFCMIPIYANHLNLGFYKGAHLNDPHKLLVGTGNMMRHVIIKTPADYRNAKVKALIKAAIDFSIKDIDKPTKSTGKTISKIKRK